MTGSENSSEKGNGVANQPVGDVSDGKVEEPSPSLATMNSENIERDVKIILLIGPVGTGKTSLIRLLSGQNLTIGHTLDHGTVIPTEIPATINDQPYIFIDCPGFGHADSQPGVIKKQIHQMLGYFTRTLGGIHGIIYVQDITTERSMPGMQEAIEFLQELAGHPMRRQITFITSKWDIPRCVRKLMRKCEAKEATLKESTWARFNIGEPDGSRYYRHGVDCEEDSEEERQQGQISLYNDAMAHYVNASIGELTMPFSEWTYLQQGFMIASVTGKIIFVGAAMAGGSFLVAAFASAIAAGQIVVTATAVAGGIVFSVRV